MSAEITSKCTAAAQVASTSSKPATFAAAAGAASCDGRDESRQTMNEWLAQLGSAAQSQHAGGNVELRQTMPPRLIGRRHKCELTTAANCSQPSANHSALITAFS